jgi:potassium-transporting ATPase KdpC subunit
MRQELRAATVLFVLLSLLTGLIYPLLVTGIGRLAFAHQVSGSLIERAGQPLGSALLGQPFDAPQYFWGRLSATTPQPYNGTASGGSNLGPTNPALFDAVTTRVQALRAADPANKAPVPVDLVTASASGLDPDISPAAAAYQIGRVARARGLSQSQVRELVMRHTSERLLGLLGEAHVNVLELNLALDQLHGG